VNVASVENHSTVGFVGGFVHVSVLFAFAVVVVLWFL
jgi:hypothetical protein